MGKRTAIGVLAVGLFGFGLYRFRRHLIGRLLGLPPPKYDVAVERNLRVTMPDGVVLMTDHYFPKARGSFPTVLMRSPYGRGSDLGPVGLFVALPLPRFAERGYHVIVQTARGRFDSEGDFEPFVDDAVDGRATLEWIARQPWFNGSLGMWGQSYQGYVQWAIASDAPSYLKALVPGVTSSQGASIIYPDNAFALDTMLRWTILVDAIGGKSKRSILEMMRRLSPGTQERIVAPAFHHLPLMGADTIAVGEPVPYYRDWLSHPPGDDRYWKAMDHRTGVARVRAATHLISGWYDILLRGLLADYSTLKAAGHSPYLTIGPWYHLDLTIVWECLREGIAWFDAHLKVDHSRLRERPVRIYVMGANEWREMDGWPPPAPETRYFLHTQGRLSTEAPEPHSPSDSYRYDPADPTPAVGGPLFNTQAGPQDNRALEARPDVLCYTTPPLDTDVEVIGPVRIELYVSSSLAHTDFFGRLCDVYPDGRSINICDGLFRVEPGKGKQPEGSIRQPDSSLRIEIDMWATANRFLRGHRIRLQVSSGAHPRWSRNLGTGEPIGTGTRMAITEQTIYHDSAHPSALILPVTTA